MSQHTPGPWRVQVTQPISHPTDYDVVVVVADGYGRVAESVERRDARLIAAAPEMLELLRGWLNGAEKKNYAWLVDHAPTYTSALLARIEGAHHG